MSYNTVYEITWHWVPLWIPISFPIIGIFCAIFLVGSRNLGCLTRIIRIAMFLFGCLWVIFVCYILHDWRQFVDAYESGSYSVVEGPVEHYSWKGKSECFSVRGQEFCHGTAHEGPWFGGNLHDGMPVRVAFYEGMMLRLEVGIAPNK